MVLPGIRSMESNEDFQLKRQQCAHRRDAEQHYFLGISALVPQRALRSCRRHAREVVGTVPTEEEYEELIQKAQAADKLVPAPLLCLFSIRRRPRKNLT